MALFRETALGPRPITRGGKSAPPMPDRWIFEPTTFIAPKSLFYTFYAWSGGAQGLASYTYSDGEGNTYVGRPDGGAAGNFGRKAQFLEKGQGWSCSPGKGGRRTDSYTSVDATATYVGGLVLYAPTARTPATLTSGWDLTLQGGAGAYFNGSAWTTPGIGQGSYSGSGSYNSGNSGGGGSAPGDVVLRGGRGGYPGTKTVTTGGFPGGGGGGNDFGNLSSGVNLIWNSGGADGLVIVIEGLARVP